MSIMGKDVLLHCVGNHIVVGIVDNGPGMPDSFIERTLSLQPLGGRGEGSGCQAYGAHGEGSGRQACGSFSYRTAADGQRAEGRDPLQSPPCAVLAVSSLIALA